VGAIELRRGVTDILNQIDAALARNAAPDELQPDLSADRPLLLPNLLFKITHESGYDPSWSPADD
jgi:hypothetical protein